MKNVRQHIYAKKYPPPVIRSGRVAHRQFQPSVCPTICIPDIRHHPGLFLGGMHCRFLWGKRAQTKAAHSALWLPGRSVTLYSASPTVVGAVSGGRRKASPGRQAVPEVATSTLSWRLRLKIFLWGVINQHHSACNTFPPPKETMANAGASDNS